MGKVKQEFIKGRPESIYESVNHLSTTIHTDKEMKTIGKCKAQLGDYWVTDTAKVTCKRCLKKLAKGK